VRIRILGCSGGIGGRHLRTTSILVGRNTLIDAGTGVVDLSLPELAAIDHLFITHSHLDHVCSLPLMVDSVGQMRNAPLIVHAMPATIEILRHHVFNWAVWPDFTQIPSASQPYLVFEPLRVGDRYDVGAGFTITPLPAVHVVPAVGYHVDAGSGSLVFTGDTCSNEALWPIVNKIANLRHLIIECAFNNRERDLAVISKHLCPTLLAEELARLERTAEIHVTHLKPGEIELTMQEIEECAGHFNVKLLQNGQTLDL
jgi:cAMP phosphodiesterase